MSAVIAHTTDLSGDDRQAFVHAAALAARSGARLVSVHGNAAAELADRLPDATPLGARWGHPIDHRRVCHECCDDVTDTLLDALRSVMPGLVVTGTHARRGLAAVLHGSVSESLARNLDVPTLVVPNRGRGFVDEGSGAIDLKRVLIPAGDVATAARGLTAARALLAVAGVTDAELMVLVVGARPLDLAAADDVTGDPRRRPARGRGARDRPRPPRLRDRHADHGPRRGPRRAARLAHRARHPRRRLPGAHRARGQPPARLIVDGPRRRAAGPARGAPMDFAARTA
jgi:hypothetical protein